MTTTSILEVIQHYQRSIEKCQNDETRLLHCISKLYKLPVNVEHLQETGIGKTVNSLRKFNGEIGVAAKALVTKWKAMVSAEDELAPLNDPNGTDDVNNGNGNGGGASSEEDNYGLNMNARSAEKTRGDAEERTSSKEKTKRDGDEKEKEKDSSRNEKSSKHKTRSIEGSSSSKHRKDEQNSHKRKREDGDNQRGRPEEPKERKKDKKDKDKDGEHRKDAHERKSGSSEKKREENAAKHHKSQKADKTEQPEGSSKHADKRDHKDTKSKEVTDRTSSKDKDHRSKDKSSNGSSERKRRNDLDSDTKDNDRPSKGGKVSQKDIKKEEVEEAEFDYSTGANFGDVLGMLNMPTKKAKKTLGTSAATAMSSQTPNGASNSKDAIKPSTSSSARSQMDKSSSTIAASSTRRVDEKPELLSSNAKLDPLDPSIALALPAISTNYKPMPLNQTVMDCVFNNGSSHSTRAPVRTLTDAEAFGHGISSKTMRTKIYSGVRTGQILQVPSLFDLCIRVLQKNIDALEYTGGVPFEVLRPVLERATPNQLMVIEDYNSYLLEDSDVLWKLHVGRNYRTQKRQEHESWRDMFIRCQDDQDRKLSILAESIKQSQKIIAAPVRKTQLAFVDSMVKPPRNVQRKQEIHGTKSKLIATPASRVAALSSVTPNAGKVGDVRLRVAASVRDAAQVSHSVRPKKAPLMAKTLQFMRGRHKR